MAGSWRPRPARGSPPSAVIIAAGVGAFGPNRPPLSGIEAYEGKSVFYYVKRREDFRGKRIVIAGGGDSAVDWALALADIASRIYGHPSPAEVPRRAGKRRAAGGLGRRAARWRSSCPINLARLEGGDGKLDAVIVSTLEGQERRLDADVLLPFFGLAMNLGPDRAMGPEPGPATTSPWIAGDLRDQPARRLRHRRHRLLSRQAEADPLGLCRGGGGGPCHPSPRVPWASPAFRVFDDVGRARRRLGGLRGPRRVDGHETGDRRALARF